MPALITVAYHTGLRVRSLLRARGRDLDLDAATLTINRTKKGLSTAAIHELRRLPKCGPDELLLGDKAGKPFTYAPLWQRIATEARLPGRVFHDLRHGHGFRLAHRSPPADDHGEHGASHAFRQRALRAASVADKKAVIERVFG
jgi:integrase